jgi:hypothetical protein
MQELEDRWTFRLKPTFQKHSLLISPPSADPRRRAPHSAVHCVRLHIYIYQKPIPVIVSKRTYKVPGSRGIITIREKGEMQCVRCSKK